MTLFCLFASCARDPVGQTGTDIEPKEIEVSYLGTKSLFGVVVKEYKVSIDLNNELIDSVDLIVIEEGTEYIYGSIGLEEAKGVIESLKVPEFIRLLYIDFWSSGVKARERLEVTLEDL